MGPLRTGLDGVDTHVRRPVRDRYASSPGPTIVVRARYGHAWSGLAASARVSGPGLSGVYPLRMVSGSATHPGVRAMDFLYLNIHIITIITNITYTY